MRQHETRMPVSKSCSASLGHCLAALVHRNPARSTEIYQVWYPFRWKSCQKGQGIKHLYARTGSWDSRHPSDSVRWLGKSPKSPRQKVLGSTASLDPSLTWLLAGNRRRDSATWFKSPTCMFDSIMESWCIGLFILYHMSACPWRIPHIRSNAQIPAGLGPAFPFS